MGRLKTTQLRNSSGNTLNYHDYTFDNASRKTRQTRLNGPYVDYTYDNIDQLLTVRGFEGAASRRHEQLTFTYDPAGNLTQRINDQLTQTFTLNTQNEVTGITASGTLTVAGMTSGGASTVTVGSTSSSVYGSDGSFAVHNQPITSSYTATAQSGGGSTAFDTVSAPLASSITITDDSNGNVIGDGRRAFAYDEENRLTSVTVSGAWSVQFGYDGLSRRRWRKEFNGSGQLLSEVRYVYDRGLVLQERDGSNNPLVTYTRGSDLSGSFQGAGGIGGLLVRADANGPAYYHSDAGGNVTMLMGPAQTAVAKYLYDPFGHLLGMSGGLADANAYRFSSKEFHANSGLYYYGFRFYEPNLQRWLNRDPLQEGGGLNLYRFAGNNPVNAIDSDGRFVDTVVDVGSILYDLYRIARDNIFGDCDNFGDNLKALGLDAAGTFIPFATGLGTASRLANHADDAIDVPQFIYRTGSQTDNALTDAAGVSFRDSVSSSADRVQVFDPGAKIWAVDVSKLPPGSVVPDGNPAGHVSVLATPSEIRSAIVPQSPANPLSDFGLKALEDGSSYRIPKK